MKVQPLVTSATILVIASTFMIMGSALAATINVPGDKATIQAAIDAASTGDSVVVAPGSYKENLNFKGKAITVASSGGAAVTTIDGNQAGSVVTFNSGETLTSVLTGFTIQNGKDTSWGGGGVQIRSSSPTISNNRIVANSAYDGGGIYVEFASPLISANVITQNPSGGGIYIGGAGSAQILDNEISYNVSGDAGGIYLFAAGTPTIRGNTIKGNTGSDGGGIGGVNESNALIVQNLIVNNKATYLTDGAGGVHFSVPASLGGPTLVNNTISGNDGPNSSGIFLNGFLANTILENNIIIGKTGQPAIYCDGSYDPDPPRLSHNLAYAPSAVGYGGTCAAPAGANGNITADPLLSDPASGGYYPLSGSPVIDAGDNTAPSLISTDLGGAPRIIDGNGDGIATVDMGVYEFDPSLPTAVITGMLSGNTQSNGASLIIGGVGIVSYRYAIDNGSYGNADTPVTVPISLTGLVNGQHTISVLGKRADGREQSPSAATIATWIVDSNPPTTSATASGGTYLSSLSVTLSCNDGSVGSGCAATYYCIGFGCTPSTPYLGGLIGIVSSSNLSFYSTDNAGNSEAIKTQNYSITFPDTSAPVITSFSIPTTYSGLTIPVTLYASDNIGVTGYCVTENTDPTGCAWTAAAPASYSLSASGAHALYAFARDAAGNVSAFASASTTNQDNFISVPKRVDMVYDSTRNLLYITSNDSVLRYQLATKSFLSPYILGGSLSGIDISPDGNTLAVADKSLTGIHLIDLRTDAAKQVTFTPVSSEGGSYSVAFGADGAVLVSAQFKGSGGGMPLRRYDPAIGVIKVIANIDQDAMLSGSADGRCIAYEGGNNSGGPVGVYDVATQMVTHTAYVNEFTSEIGANRNCTQFAVPTYGGTFILDDFLNSVNTIGLYAKPQPIEVAYHPNADIVFFAWSGTSEVRAFDTTTLAQTATYDFLDTFTGADATALVPGRLKISRDGSVLFAAVKDGIRFVQLTSTPVADNQSVITYGNTPVAITLTGKSPVEASLTYQLVTSPLHGTLTGTAPLLTYTPQNGYSGEDGFTFTVNDGSANSAPAQVAITVVQDAVPPVISSFVLPATSPSLIVAVSKFTASDNTGVSGYCLSEVNNSSGCRWTTTAPSSYAFKSSGTVTLFAFARDYAGNVSSLASATVVITLADTLAPTITGFTMPATSSSLTVPVTFSAADNTGVAGYCLSETNDAGGCAWNSYAPASYSFGGYGSHTLYAFARDQAGNISAPASAPVTVTGPKNFIPASERVDMVYDNGRDVVYVANGKSVLRYNLATGTFLSPYKFAGTLAGLDISPDGTTLAVTDTMLTGIHLVDLQADTIKPDITFTPAYGEAGGYAVAYGNDGALLVTTQYAGTGGTPLRRVDPQTGSITIIANQSIRFSGAGTNTALSGSADGSCIAIAEGNDSGGPFGIYDVALQQVSSFLEPGTNAFNSGLAVNWDCTQYSVVSDSGTFIYNGGFTNLTQFGQRNAAQPMGAAYHPSANIVYLSWLGTGEVRAYETASFSQIADYNFDTTFNGRINGGVNEGRLKVSRDGSLLLATMNGGVRYQRLSANVVADDQAVATNPNTPVSVYLTGSNMTTSASGYQLLTSPAHGTLSGTAPSLIYTPAPTFRGQDSFTFAINDGAAQSNAATISITVPVDATPPVIKAFSVNYYASSPTVQITQFTVSDNVAASWYCVSETASSSDCTWSAMAPRSYTFSGLVPPQGVSVSKTLYAFARDAAQNVSSPALAQVAITIPDTTPPAIIGFMIPSRNVGLTIPVSVLASDNLAVYSYCLTENTSLTNGKCSGDSPGSYTFSDGGNHTLYAFARDTAGNVSVPVSAVVTILLPPAITSPAGASFSIGSPGSFTVTATGYPVPSLSISGSLPNGVTFSDNSNGTATISGTPADGSDGSYPFTLTATNGMGSDATQSFILTIVKPTPRLTVSTLSDLSISTLPVLNVSGAAASIYGIQSVTINGVAVELNSEGDFSCPVNLAKGCNTITVVCTDKNGVTTTDSRSIVLDAGAPALIITSPDDGSVSSNQTIGITGSVAESTNTVFYTVNNGMPQWASMTNSIFTATATLTSGLNTLEFIVFDLRGGSSRVKRTVFYSPAFSLAITIPGNDIKTDMTDYLLTGTIANNSTPVTVSISVNGATYTPTVANGEFQQHITLVAEKVYPVIVTATDQNNATVSVQRNIARVWFGDTTGGSNGSGAITIADALNMLKIVTGNRQATPNDLLRIDIAPLSSDGKPQGDGKIDIADIIMALRKLVGVSSW